MVDLSTSPSCARGDHDGCPHWVAMRVGGLWRRRPFPELILCADGCHQQCPLAGRRKAAQDDWAARCTCPGAEVSRRFLERAEARRAAQAHVFADVDLSGHPDAATIERRLRASLQTHGQPVPRGLTGMSEAVAAVTGRRGTRFARLVALAARTTAAGVRWAWQPGTAADATDRRALRRMYVSLATLTGIAGLLTTAAVRTSGWRRLPWAVSALLLGLFTTRSVALGTLATTMLRTVEGGGADESGCRPGSVAGAPRGTAPAGGHPSTPAVAGRLLRSTRRLGRAALERLRRTVARPS